MLLSPLYSVLLNVCIPPKAVYKRNSSIMHCSVYDVKWLRKERNKKVAIFGMSMMLTGVMLLASWS